MEKVLTIKKNIEDFKKVASHLTDVPQNTILTFGTTLKIMTVARGCYCIFKVKVL